MAHGAAAETTQIITAHPSTIPIVLISMRIATYPIDDRF